MKIGLNVESAVLANPGKLAERIAQFSPDWSLGLGLGSAQMLKNAGVKNVTTRIYTGENNLRETADQWMARFHNVAEANLYCEVLNEVGMQTTFLTNERTGILPNALKRGFKITAPAPSVGGYEPGDLRAARAYFELAAQYPGQLMTSVHEYFPDLPENKLPSEWHWTKPASPARNPDGSPNWWFTGRWECFAFPLCDEWHLPRPDYIITEFGEAQPTRAGQARNSPFASGRWPTPNGARSLFAWYEKCYPGYSGGQLYAKMITWYIDRFYRSPQFKALILYCYGADPRRQPNSENDWSSFDVELLEDFWAEMARWYTPGVSTMLDKPNVTPEHGTLTVPPPFLNIRTGPDITYTDFGDAYDGLRGNLYQDPRIPDWFYFEPDTDSLNMTLWRSTMPSLTGGWMSWLHGQPKATVFIKDPPKEMLPILPASPAEIPGWIQNVLSKVYKL